jgi:hypothetical protein
LDLLESNSGRLLASTHTADNGEFSFDSVAPGLYFLSLKPQGLRAWTGGWITGLIAVRVDEGAAADHVDIDLGWTSCGLWYADRNQCPQPDLQIAQLSGQVVDDSGVPIGGATILVLDHTEKPVGRLQSDGDGRFTWPDSLAGTYELVVSASGFTPLRRTAHVEPALDSARSSRLAVRLGIGGRCSSAEPR